MSIYTKILIEARKRIESGTSDCVCYALLEGAYAPRKYHWIVLKWVVELLDGFGSYIDWLFVCHPEFYKQMSPADIRAGRLQWLDWMIANVDKEILK